MDTDNSGTLSFEEYKLLNESPRSHPNE